MLRNTVFNRPISQVFGQEYASLRQLLTIFQLYYGDQFIGSGTPEYQEYRSLRQLLTIIQLYHGGHFIGSGTLKYQEQTTDLP